jgi:uncharacterized iron-regulated membrane protein
VETASDPPPSAVLHRPKAPARERLLSSKRLFALHGWIGLHLGLILLVICFSGAIAVVSHEIDWLLNRAIRVPSSTEPMQWSRVIAGARSALPEAQLQYVRAPLGPRFAAEAIMQTPSGQSRRVYVHPASGVVQGHTPYLNVQRFFRSLHMGLFIEKPLSGILFVAVFSLALLFSAVSALLFFKGWTRHLLPRMRLRQSARAFASDLHRFLGTWSLLFALLIAGTGIWYLVEDAAYAAGSHWMYDEAPSVPAERVAARAAGTPPLDADALVARARALVPTLEPRTFSPGNAPDAVATVDGQTGEWLVRDRAAQVHLDPYDGETMGVRRARDMSFARRWVDTADELHFGTLGRWGGLWSKVLWASAGMLLPALILSGAYLSQRRGGAPDSRAGLVSAFLTCAALAWAAISGWAEIRSYGELVPGTKLHALPQVSPAVWIVITAFCTCTLLIVGAWLRLLWTRPTAAQSSR